MQEKIFDGSTMGNETEPCVQKKSLENEATAKDNLEATQGELKESQKEANLDDYKEMLNQLQQEKEELNNQYLRLVADFQNYKKRIDKEKSDIYEFANEQLVLELLPVIDNFERALQTTKEVSQDKKFVEGVEMILQQLLDVLNKNGVQEIVAMGKTFDPNFHHAVMQEENPDYAPNTIIEVFQKGYTLRQKVVRPSMVKVVN